MVEIHRVAQIELIQLAQRGTGVAQRALEIDAFEVGGQLLRKDAAERLLLTLQALLHQVQTLLQEPAAKGTTVLDGVMHIPRAERGRDPERAVFAASVVSCLAAWPHESICEDAG